MRITGGIASGIEIFAPKGETRPVLERTRIALFSSLGDLSDAFVVDLFAGSGAFGIEAASRGAGKVVFVEKNHSACKTIQRNLEQIANSGLKANFQIVNADVFSFIHRNQELSPDIIFLDPPYAQSEKVISQLIDNEGFANFAKSSRIIIKIPDKFNNSIIFSSTFVDFELKRRFGGTDFLFIRIKKTNNK